MIRRLFDICVRHESFAAGVCPDVRLVPRAWHPGGVRALARHRLLARQRPDGLEILVDVDPEGHTAVALSDLPPLEFDLQIVGPDLAHYTDLDAWDHVPLPTYRGAGPAGGALELGPGVASPPPGVAAGVEISGTSATWLDAPPRFSLELPSARALWVYYLLTSRTGDTAPTIVDREPGRALEFRREFLTTDLVQADDPVGHDLVSRNLGRRCFRMTSAQALPASRVPVRHLALALGDEILISELSNPLIHSHARLTVEPSPEPRRALFRVIEY